jgi:hypothetical protein
VLYSVSSVQFFIVCGRANCWKLNEIQRMHFMLLSTMVGIRCVKMRHELCSKVATGRMFVPCMMKSPSV